MYLTFTSRLHKAATQSYYTVGIGTAPFNEFLQGLGFQIMKENKSIEIIKFYLNEIKL